MDEQRAIAVLSDLKANCEESLRDEAATLTDLADTRDRVEALDMAIEAMKEQLAERPPY